jgi:hypothetical protein
MWSGSARVNPASRKIHIRASAPRTLAALPEAGKTRAALEANRVPRAAMIG